MQVGRSLLTVVKASAKLMTKPGMLPGGLCPVWQSALPVEVSRHTHIRKGCRPLMYRGTLTRTILH